MDFTKLRNPRLRNDLQEIFANLWVGKEASKASINASVNALSLYTTSSTITGSIRSGIISQTMTAAATSSQVEVLRVELVSDVKTGAWANAIVGSINYSTSGAAHGMAAAICAEMIPPNSSLSRGALYALDLEIGCGENSSWGSAGPVAFLKLENWGTKAYFSANAFLFHLAGESAGSGNIFQTGNTLANAVATLKVRVGTTTYYLPLYDGQITTS